MTQVKGRRGGAPALRNEGGTLRDRLGIHEASACARGANPPLSMRAPCSIACSATPSAPDMTSTQVRAAELVLKKAKAADEPENHAVRNTVSAEPLGEAEWQRRYAR